ncbi:MAG: hypothetical protein ACJAT5_000267 [Lentimonas sp.]|jgi:hypothetical protein
MPNDNNINLEHLLIEHPILLKEIKGGGPALQKNLFQKADESDFSLADWVDSLDVLYRWLDQEGLALSFQDRLGYVSCAAKSVGNSSTLNHLPSLVHDLLEQYGCELAIKK